MILSNILQGALSSAFMIIIDSFHRYATFES